MVAGYILVCANHRSIDISVRWTVLGLAVCAGGAAVGGFAVEPNQPSAIDFGDLGDFAACYVGDRAFAVGSNTGISKRRCHRVFTVNGDIQRFSLRAAVGRGINQLCGKIRIRLYIYAHDGGRGFMVAIVQQGIGIGGGFAVKVQQGHAIRQDHVGAAAVCGIFDLCHNRNNGIVCAVQQGRGHGKAVIVQCSGSQITAAFFQLAFGPLGNADFSFTSGNRQTLATDIGAYGCIGQVSVQFRADNSSRNFFFSGLLFCRFRGGFGYILAGVWAALVGLAVVCFRRLGLMLHLHGFLGGLRCGFLRKRCTGQHGAEHYRRRKQRGNAVL